jgi:(2R)-3-sulfolactate dehydrogenase (NADP+)
MPRLSPNELATLAAHALERAGARQSMAQAAAEALVAADAQGLATHGVSRIPFYAAMLRNGRADGNAAPKVVREKAAVCLIDNGSGLAYESVRFAAAEASARAREFGIGLAAIANGHHMGALGLAVEPIARSGLVGVALSSSPAAIPAPGGRRPLVGTNPVAAAFPRAGSDPVVVDLSLTTVTRGKIMLAAQRGEPIPEGWALDETGRPTTDAKRAMEKGSLAPIGGAKGAALALAIEILCGALTGAAFGFENDSFFAESGNRPRIGQVFLAIDPGALAGTQVYLERIEALVAAMLAEEGVRVPGERRFALARAAATGGIELPDALLAELRRLAEA